MNNQRKLLLLSSLAIAVFVLVGGGIVLMRRSNEPEIPVLTARKPPRPRPGDPAIPGVDPSSPDDPMNGQDGPRRPPPSTSLPVIRSPKEVAEVQSRILDEALDPQKRMKALRELRYMGDDWKDPRVLSSMSVLLGKAEDEGVRMNICRLIRGADTAMLRQQLVNSVCRDDSSGVRREAAASLRSAAGDPAVQATLREALKVEKNAGVKSELERTLLAGKR